MQTTPGKRLQFRYRVDVFWPGVSDLETLGQKERLMDTEQKRQTTLRVTPSKIPRWHQRVREMQKCETPDALVTLHGPPHHKVQQKGFEIWHYTLGIESGMSYSIHVSVWPDQSKQVFLYFEPTTERRRRWWQFWKTKAQPEGGADRR